MTYIEQQLQQFNLSQNDWNRLCHKPLATLRADRGQIRSGFDYIIEYSGMPVFGCVRQIIKGKFTEYYCEFINPISEEAEFGYFTEFQIKLRIGKLNN